MHKHLSNSFPEVFSSADFIILLLPQWLPFNSHGSGWISERPSYLFLLLLPKLFWTGTTWLPVPEVLLLGSDSENIHPLRNTQIGGHNAERPSLLAVSLWAPQQGQTGLYIRCQTHKQHQSLSKGSGEVKWIEQNLNYAAAVSIEINMLR